MKLFVCTNYDGFYPVGVASVVVAEDEEHALLLLDSVLVEAGLQPSHHTPYRLEEVSTDRPIAIILNDGNY